MMSLTRSQAGAESEPLPIKLVKHRMGFSALLLYFSVNLQRTLTRKENGKGSREDFIPENIHGTMKFNEEINVIYIFLFPEVQNSINCKRVHQQHNSSASVLFFSSIDRASSEGAMVAAGKGSRFPERQSEPRAGSGEYDRVSWPSLVQLRSATAMEADGAQPKRRTFKKFSFRGVDLDQLLDMGTDELVKLFTARARRRFQRGLKRKPMALIKKLRKAKREAPPGEKPEPVRTHLRNMIIVPEMIGSIVGVYNGKTFNQVEIKPEMIGHYLAEFSISYKPVKHGRPGIGATHSSRFIPLK
ncbi:hypothetical protein H6P81_019140 [Aristolochia fimbriata]|uniref:40S ribosomal protein S15 n=1 Tax=Aristolochia fimbriata TaxID=158543 RepID=A0AAV7DQY5_ARIFI|nr:hypothetical protein H6P81_019140 [Aristolochia fimbriata]